MGGGCAALHAAGKKGGRFPSTVLQTHASRGLGKAKRPRVTQPGQESCPLVKSSRLLAHSTTYCSCCLHGRCATEPGKSSKLSSAFPIFLPSMRAARSAGKQRATASLISSLKGKRSDDADKAQKVKLNITTLT